jgi:hypothetical protein
LRVVHDSSNRARETRSARPIATLDDRLTKERSLRDHRHCRHLL